MVKSWLKLTGIIVSLLGSIAVITGISYAAFVDQLNFSNTYVSVGSADLKLVNNLAVPPTEENLVDEKESPRLEQVSPSWKKDYLLKLYSNASSIMEISTKANYATVNDPDDIRRYLMVEIFDWSDTNNNGLLDESEELGQSYGKKNIIDWKSEGFKLKDLDIEEIKGYVMRFSAPNIPSDKQNKEGRFDFEFNSVAL